MLQIKRKKDERVIRAFDFKLADIPGGITIKSSELASGVLHEGTPISIGSDGFGHIVKTAKLASSATNSATTYVVAKGHHLKVGEYIMAKTGGKAYAITNIATNSTDSNCDDITVGTTLGVAIAQGGALIQAKAESTSTSSAFKEAPVAMVGESYDVEPGENIIVNAVTIGQVQEAKLEIALGEDVKKALSHINFI